MSTSPASPGSRGRAREAEPLGRPIGLPRCYGNAPAEDGNMTQLAERERIRTEIEEDRRAIEDSRRARERQREAARLASATLRLALANLRRATRS